MDSNTLSNHLNSIDLPLLAGYTMGRDHFRISINAGVILNLNTRYNGEVLTNYFKTNTGMSLYLGVDLEEQINERISVFGEPYYRYRLSPMTINSVDFDKFIDIAGLSIGMRYYFKK